MKKSFNLLEVVGGLTASLVAILVSATFGAFVGLKLYNWFMLPLGAPAISMGHLYGAVLFFRYLLPKWQKAEENKDESVGYKIFSALLIALLSNGVALIGGWLIHGIIY